MGDNMNFGAMMEELNSIMGTLDSNSSLAVETAAILEDGKRIMENVLAIERKPRPVVRTREELLRQQQEIEHSNAQLRAHCQRVYNVLGAIRDATNASRAPEENRQG
uniref:Biogenesis of lysosome-related organelles complex 1 subunit 7 n=1 Tax=Caenorhabditis tropicalis TaxID=1561998 RepID=A0A1I7U136_9PELO